MMNRKNNIEELRARIGAAAGRTPAELVLKNADYVSVFSGAVLHGDIAISGGRIVGVGSYSGLTELDLTGKTVCPGLIDGHIHLESAMVSPAEFARAAVPHGTTTVITDPHEIANVMGADGVRFLLEASEGLPLDVRVMLPSCVPATPLDEAGAVLNAADLAPLYDHPRVLGLAELMNFVGAVGGDAEVLEKLVSAGDRPIDGHAPGLSGIDLNAYVSAGITSDHECTTAAEAIEKLEKGQYILIREGTAAKNLQALLPLLTERYASRCLFCSDDRHPDDLEAGHIDAIVRAAVRAGVEPTLAVRVASFNAAQRFGLNDRGAVAPGYLADLTVVDGLESFRVERVFKSGREVWRSGETLRFDAPKPDAALLCRAKDSFRVRTLTAGDFGAEGSRGVIGLVPGQIVSTDEGMADCADPAGDRLKFAVIERHHSTGHIGLCYLKGYGLRAGAVATSVAHDSHNLIAVGTNEADMAAAANAVAAQHGGIAVVRDGEVLARVTLELAGLMSDRPLEAVSAELRTAVGIARGLGVHGDIDPFMTLSFMSLPVIPALRLTTRGAFDVTQWRYL